VESGVYVYLDVDARVGEISPYPQEYHPVTKVLIRKTSCRTDAANLVADMANGSLRFQVRESGGSLGIFPAYRPTFRGAIVLGGLCAGDLDRFYPLGPWWPAGSVVVSSHPTLAEAQAALHSEEVALTG
jgi:hypothetical protein